MLAYTNISFPSTTQVMVQPKSRHDENFPVGSWLVAPKLRPVVHAYYAFARRADDIADSPDLEPGVKIRRLDAMDESLRTAGTAISGDREDLEVASILREHLAEMNISHTVASDLLVAFRRDAVNDRYRTWGELMDYCRFSACPVGRFLLGLHGETLGTVESDALCSALQVLNHIQDAKADYLSLNRVYVPLDWLRTDCGEVEDLGAERSSPAVRQTIQRMNDYTGALIDRAAPLSVRVTSRRLAAEVAVCLVLARRLNCKLAASDPIESPVKLGRPDWLFAGLTGLTRLVRP